MTAKMQMNTYRNMEKKNYRSVLQGQNLYRWRMLQRSGILKTKLQTLYVMALRQGFKSVWITLMTSFQLIPVNLLLSLVYLVPVSVILSTKWLLDTTRSTAGKQLMLRLKMYQPFYTLTS